MPPYVITESETAWAIDQIQRSRPLVADIIARMTGTAWAIPPSRGRRRLSLGLGGLAIVVWNVVFDRRHRRRPAAAVRWPPPPSHAHAAARTRGWTTGWARPSSHAVAGRVGARRRCRIRAVSALGRGRDCRPVGLVSESDTQWSPVRSARVRAAPHAGEVRLSGSSARQCEPRFDLRERGEQRVADDLQAAGADRVERVAGGVPGRVLEIDDVDRGTPACRNGRWSSSIWTLLGPKYASASVAAPRPR